MVKQDSTIALVTIVWFPQCTRVVIKYIGQVGQCQTAINPLHDSCNIFYVLHNPDAVWETIERHDAAVKKI